MQASLFAINTGHFDSLPTTSFLKRNAESVPRSAGLERSAEETINLTADHEQQRRTTIDKLTGSAVAGGASSSETRHHGKL